jgi:serpin B
MPDFALSPRLAPSAALLAALALPALPSCTPPNSRDTATDTTTGDTTTGTTTVNPPTGTTTTEPTTDPSTGDTTTTAGEEAPPLPPPPGEEFGPSKPQNQDPDATAEELAQMADDERAFGVALFKALAPTTNAAIAPTSLRTAFGMTYAGARTISEAEIKTALVFTPPKDRVHVAFNRIDLDLESRNLPPSGEVDGDDSVQLIHINEVFGRSNITGWLPEFLDVLAVSYGSPLHLLDFAGDPNGSRKAINAWVNDITRDKIPELLPPLSIDPSTTTVLVNATYLKAPWDTPFDYVNLQGSFTRLDDSKVQAAMMNVLHGDTRYFKGAGAEAVELPLRGDHLTMVVILPDPGTFTEFAGQLDGPKLGELFAGLAPLAAEVTLPRFTARADLGLQNALTQLGIISSWELGGADFSGMTEAGIGWAIKEVYHDVFVAVDEKGVEAAAASAVVIQDTGHEYPSPEVSVTADRPFLFAIRDLGTDSLLFLGQVVDPTL